ncbi:MAG: FAD-dependent monooxygenase [Methyloceanibacter sp.]|uniref:FAD-dependent monooxygenase n=1 Tax=Methyloceanibacter sp. TaxID=1965321 RepID=UPI003D6CB8F5
MASTQATNGPKPEEIRSDVAVVGAGPAGIAAALALAHVGARTALIGPAPSQSDDAHRETRTAALLASSVDFLKRLEVWDALAPHAAPLKAIRIIDASRSLLRSPDVTFEAAELGLEAFGYNVANTVLLDALYARAREILPLVLDTSAKEIALDAHEARLKLGDGQRLTARLVAGADGRKSVCREAAGIETSEWRYDQGAIATSFRHTRHHDGVSTELHKESGSVTTVPTTDKLASSLIWVGPPAEIADLMAGHAAGFAVRLQERLGESLGTISDVGPRAEFPVAGLTAKRLAHNRTALVGEAAHILPPIGAQGLNLGLRDAAALADCVAGALRRGHDPGGMAALSAYVRARQLDVLSRTIGVDLLNRSLLTSLIPVQAARGLFLHGLNALPPLRRMIMRAGLAPPAELPSLMRPQPAGLRA